jgi:hypothetical protein
MLGVGGSGAEVGMLGVIVVQITFAIERKMSRKLDRPVSMLSIVKRLRRSIVLKLLGSEKKVRAQGQGMQRVYFLR